MCRVMIAASTTGDTDTGGNPVTNLLRRVIQSYRRRDYAAKRLASVTGVSHRTAEDWLQDRTLPANAETLLRLAAEHPELQAAVNAHIERLRFASEMKQARRKAHAALVRENSADPVPRYRPLHERD